MAEPEEKLWIQAKNIARTRGRSMDWAFIIDVYTRIGGYKTRVFYQDADKHIFRLLGVYTDYQDLVLSDEDKLLLVPHEEVLTKKKIIDKDGTDKYQTYQINDINEDIIGDLITKGYKNKEIKVYN